MVVGSQSGTGEQGFLPGAQGSAQTFIVKRWWGLENLRYFLVVPWGAVPCFGSQDSGGGLEMLPPGTVVQYGTDRQVLSSPRRRSAQGLVMVFFLVMIVATP